MTRASFQKTVADFRNGLVSGTNDAVFPDNTAKDISNFLIEDNGSISVRSGLVEQSAFADMNLIVGTEGIAGPTGGFNTGPGNTRSVQTFVWKDAGEVPNFDLLVVRNGKRFVISRLFQSTIDIFNTIVVASFGLNINENDAVDFTTIKGALIIVTENLDPFRLSFLVTGSSPEELDPATISNLPINTPATNINVELQIRDTELWALLDSNVSVSDGTSKAIELSPQHDYNLRNAGWLNNGFVGSPDTDTTPQLFISNPILYSKLILGVYPPVNISFQSAERGLGPSIQWQKSFLPERIRSLLNFNGTGPIGKFIVDPFFTARTGAGTTTLGTRGGAFSIGTVDVITGDGGEFTSVPMWGFADFISTTKRPSVVTSFAGRVWYTGVADSNFSGNIYYSQIIKEKFAELGRCYQDADPTNPEINEVVATDGGVINITNLGVVYKLSVFQTSLIVFTSNGVWAISGKDLNSFDPTNFSVRKISDVEILSKNSITSDQDTTFVVGINGLYVLTNDQVSGAPSLINISDAKIKEFFSDIPKVAKENSILVYDPKEKILLMFYNKGPADQILNFNQQDLRDRVLVYNVDLQAFYIYDIANTGTNRVVGAFYYDKGFTSSQNQQLFILTHKGDGRFIYTSTFSNDQSFTDWGTPYKASITTGFDSLGDLLRKTKKVPAISAHMVRTEILNTIPVTNESSCILSYRWDWENIWRGNEQIYRYTRSIALDDTNPNSSYNKSVITGRTRLRGRGHSLSLRFETDVGKNLKLLGYSILGTVRNDSV